MKHIKHLISWTIWTLVALYVLILILVQLPSVQHRLGSKVAAVLGQKLGTEVTIGRVDLGFLNRLIVDDVVVKDQAEADMLRASRISAKIDVLPLFEGRVSIASAQLFGAHVVLYKTDSVAPLNCQFVADAFASNDSTSNSPLDLRIGSLIVRQSSVDYDRHDAAQTPGVINPNHLHLSDISAHILLRTLRPDSLNINVKRLALHEQSGLSLKRLAFRLEGNAHDVQLSDVSVQLPSSYLSIPLVTAKYRFDGGKTVLSYRGSAALPQLKLPDLSFILPELKHFDEALIVSTDFSGTDHSIDVPHLSINSESHSLSLETALTADWQTPSPVWSARDYQVSATNALLDQLRQVFPDIPELLTRVGDVKLSGRANGLASGDIVTDNDLLTGIGRLSAQLTLGTDRQFSGHLVTDSLHLGRLFDQPDLGVLTTQVDVSGTSGSINAEGTIARLDFNDYTYRDIDLNASYSNNGDIAGKLKIDDPNITTDVEGQLRHGQRSTVRLTGFIRNLSPHALHLTDRWGDAHFSAVIDADFVASSLNDAEGSIDLDDFVMMPADTATTAYRLDNLHVKSGYNDGVHYMRLNGDMGEMLLQGKFDWATLPQSFVNYTKSKLPTLPGLPKTTEPTDNNFEATMRLTDTRWLEQLLGVHLNIERPLSLQARVNDQANDIDIDAQIPVFTYNDGRYAGGRIRLTTEGDTARCDARLTKLMENQRRMDLHLTAQAADNQLLTSLLWVNNALVGDSAEAMNGVFNAITQLYTNDNGKSEAHVRVQPSRVNMRGTEWELEPSDILYSDKRLMVDQFNLRHGEQHLIIDGIASTSANDSLVVDLNGIEVAYVLDLVGFHAVDFGGRATGKAYVTQAFDELAAWADLEVDQFTFQGGSMGTLMANAEWSRADQQVDIDAFADDGPDAQTFIEGFIAPGRDDINLLIRARGTNIDFVNSFTDSFLSDVSGQANGDVELIGPLSGVNLVGALAVDGRATVTALNTTYDLRDDSILFVPDDVRFDRHRIYDNANHTAYITGALHHRNFTDFTFDLDVEARNLLAYDFPTFDDGIICGTGHADLHGLPGEVVINCNVTPQRGSFFAYNAANPDAISNQQFITWGEKSSADSIGVLSEVLSPAQYRPSVDIPSDIYINFIHYNFFYSISSFFH